MVWDGLILLLFLSLAVAGWNVGIVNSWRGPLAVVIATVATQQFYVDFATWILQQLRISPEQAIGIGYVLLWGAIEISCELILSVVLPFNRKERPMLAERVGGVLLGLLKAFVVVILPLMVLAGPIKIPKAPPDKSALINPMDSGIDKSALLEMLSHVGRGFEQAFGGVVVSDKEPSFKPNFAGTTPMDEEKPAK